MMLQRPKSRSEEVTMRLRQEIVDGTFELGSALSETMIATRYNVSRTPVREAFAALGIEGLVRTEPQQGTYVFRISNRQFAALSEVRSIIEMAALRLAYERSRKALLRQWARLLRSMREAAASGDSQGYCRLDGEFHQAIMSLADNPHIIEAAQSFATKIAAVRNRLGANPEHMKRSLAEHEELVRLLTLNRINSAVELLDHHIRFKSESFWSGAADWNISLDTDEE